MLISVHIPKTGGSTVRCFLRRTFAERCLLDYADFPMRHPASLRNSAAQSARDTMDVGALREAYDCVHGHFLPVKYARVGAAFRAIWVRKPASLVASRYAYHQRRNASAAERGEALPMPNLEATLHAHVLNRHYQNLYAQYLVGIDLSNFDFVGITERFEPSFRVFCRMQGLHFVLSDLEPQNVNPDQASAKYDLEQETKQLIESMNRQDIRLYEQALRINDQLLSQHG